MGSENAFDICRDCMPGDMLVTGSPNGDDDPVVFHKPTTSLSIVNTHVMRAVPQGVIALVVSRHSGHPDWALVLCDEIVGWINALSVREKVCCQ